jgi:hypothetical protein
MKLTLAFSMAVLSLLSGCTTGSVGSGTVFHTATGQSITAATSPTFINGHYQFVDAKGQTQSLYLSQVTKVSQR